LGLEMHLLWRDYRSGDSGKSNARKTVILNEYNELKNIVTPDLWEGNNFETLKKAEK
jgi:hypothetical protein